MNLTGNRIVHSDTTLARPRPLTQMAMTTDRIPPATMRFWVIAILSAFLGETVADFLRITLKIDLAWAAILISGLLAFALLRQVQARRHRPWRYWSVLVLISLDSMMLTDHLSARWPVSLELSCSLLFAALLVNLIAWFSSERTLSLHQIDSIKRELFYWSAIFLSCAFGTVIGDEFATQWTLGYGHLAVLAGALIAVVTAVSHGMHADIEWKVWILTVLIRPLGSSCADLLIKPPVSGGLGVDVTTACLLALMAIILIVATPASTRRECSVAEKIA